MISDQIVSSHHLCYALCMTQTALNRETYHHGNLPQTLISTAADVLAEKGIDGFSMREVARRAGVAVAAPSHHFGNAKGLLTAVATCAFERLTEEQTKAMECAATPQDKVISSAFVYADMSVRFPGYAAVLFRWDMMEHTDEDYVAAADRSFGLLRDAISDALAQGTPALEIDHTAKSIWAMVHGFVTLSLADGDEANDRIAFGVRAVLKGVSPPLTATIAKSDHGGL